jgi:DNA-binding MurR/RpiR family transcriptional regulator
VRLLRPYRTCNSVAFMLCDTHEPAEMMRTAREAAHMSASELARRAGVSVSTVTRLEQGS